MPDSLANEQAIFQAARALSTGDVRQAYLRGACGSDAALLVRVEALLRAHDKSRDFLETPLPPFKSSTKNVPPAEQPGALVGPYKLLEVIGEGGMGIVYRAEQTEPVARQVALKIIKAGMDTRQTIARFEAERQALAMMEHPNIARVLDAGTTESGRLYFVMELVNGVPITQYCDEKWLDVRRRLELMLPVCQAIQHAHQKGIIHRDIKPSNVLVARYDEHPVPKVIDFGVAKATQARIASEGSVDWTFTHIGQVIGTLEYMSPEQAEMNPRDIDTRSDIYSLGVLLYELLTGVTPFGRQQLREAAFHEVLRIIREEEPARPSTMLSSLDTLPSVAATRSTEPACLTQSIRGELDWIVMKALDKDRRARYDTASSLALDLQRYLNDEQVEACPPSAAYRFRKFSRRNKVALTTAILVALALVVGASVSTWQAIRATRAESLAKNNEARALVEEANTRTAAAAESAQRTKAEEQTRLAEEKTRLLDLQRQRLEESDRINSIVIKEILSVLSGLSKDDTARHRLLTNALKQISDLDPHDRIEAYDRIAKSFVALNDLASAADAYSAALAIEPNNAALLVGQGDVHYRRRNFSQAEDAYHRAIEHGNADDSVMESTVPLARRALALIGQNRIDDALADLRASTAAFPKSTIDLLSKPFPPHATSILLDPAGFSPDPRLQTALIEQLDRYVEDQNRSVVALGFRADLLATYGEFDRAQDDYAAIIATGAESHIHHYSLAVLTLARGDQPAYREACTAMLARFRQTGDWSQARMTAYACGLAPGALNDYQPVIALARQALAQRAHDAESLMALGMLHFRAGQYKEANQRIRAAIAGQSGATRSFGPYRLAMVLHQEGRREEARRQLQQAINNTKPKGNWRFNVLLKQIEREATEVVGLPAQAAEPQGK